MHRAGDDLYIGVKELLEEVYDFTSLDSLLEDYSNFITACRKGYDLAIEDYLNDLEVRNAIELVIKNYPKDVLGDFSTKVSELDGQLRSMLIRKDISLWGDNVIKLNSWNPNQHWWLFGYPSKSTGMFLADIKAFTDRRLKEVNKNKGKE